MRGHYPTKLKVWADLTLMLDRHVECDKVPVVGIPGLTPTDNGADPWQLVRKVFVMIEVI